MLNNQKLELIIIFLLITFGLYLSLISGYGSDEDTLPMIGVFEGIINSNPLMASRFTPYPVAELGIGFLSYNFGSGTANLITFVFMIIGIIFFYYGVTVKIVNKNLIYFLLLCLSSPVLFFDNLEPIDYSWAFLPLGMGIFFLRKNYMDLAVVLFGISVGTRIYFLAFVLVIIFYYNYYPKVKIQKKITLFLSSFFIGGLFYLPIWFENGFGLSWLTAVTPNEQGIFGLISRFIYKIIMAFSLVTFLTIVIIFIKKFNSKVRIEKSELIIPIILINLLIFFFIPAEISYLQPMLVAFYYLIARNFHNYYIYIIVFIQLISWIIEINFLKINYINKNKCNNVEAIDANINFSIIKGRYLQFVDSRDQIKCWVLDDSIRSKKILDGKALKK
tara:strand:+ start:425 stop:1591 length:1167 start_codon:yes stop_codon:yes gene_type:complete